MSQTDRRPVGTVVEEVRSNRIAVVMFATLLLSYVINAMDRQLYPVIAKDIAAAFSFTLPQSGLLATVFTLGMGVAGIPTGILLARSSRRMVAYAGLTIFSLATLMTALSVGFWDLLAYRFASGLGEAMQLTALLTIAGGYFVYRRALAVGAINFTFGVGALIGPNLGGWIAASAGWQRPLIVFGVAGLIILPIVTIAVRSWFTEAKGAQAPTSASYQGARRLVERNPLLIAAATVLSGIAIYSYLGLYPTYLREEHGYSTSQAGLALSMYGLGALFSLAGGWMADKYDFRKVLAGGMVVSAVLGFVLFSGVPGLGLHLVLSLLYGAAVSGVVFANLASSTIKVMHREATGKGSGLFVASMYIPAAFAGYLFGMLADALSWTAGAAVLIVAFLLVAAVLVMLVDPPAGVVAVVPKPDDRSGRA